MSADASDASDVQAASRPARIAGQASTRFDWGIALLCVWLIVGFYLDLWAHAHGMVDDTFLTPWHAVLYAGAATFGLTLGLVAARNLARRCPWREALPGPYLVSLGGAIAFVVAGQADFVWHSMFGFEVSVEALLSPPHLALAACGIVALSGPVRSVWSHPWSVPSWWRHGPALMGLTAILSLFAAFTQYAHPVADPRAQAVDGSPVRGPLSQLYAMAADGTDQRRIAISDVDERGPRLSPDGRQLVFGAFVDGSGQIVVSDPDGSHRHPVATEGNNGGATWSPDGRHLAFQSDRAGSLDVYKMAADGSDVRRVTAWPSSDWGPAWSPDGTRIAFASDRDGPGTDVYTALADGSDVRRLTTGGGGDPAWSPDGTRIAFDAPGPDGGTAIVSMAADGTDPRRLTDPPGSSSLPAWSPDGRSIAFATDRDGDLEVYVMDADGTDQRNLTRSPGITDGWFGPSWSPDGRSILYPSQGEGASPQADEVGVALGAAGILIQSALLAGVALVALRRGPVPFGGMTLLIVAPTTLMTLVSDESRFIPWAIVAGVVADLLVWRLSYGVSRRKDAVIAFAIPAGVTAAYFVTLEVTAGIGWTIHLWLGAIVLSGAIGLVLDEAMRAVSSPRPDGPAPSRSA